MNTRYGTNYRSSDLKKIPREEIDEKLIERAFEVLHAINLSEGAPLLDEDYGTNMLIAWMRNKFGIEVPLEQLRALEPDQIRQRLVALAEQGYRRKESEYPVLAGVTRFGIQVGQNQYRLDNEALAQWATQRFETEITPDQLRGNTLNDVREALLKYSEANYEQGLVQTQAANAKLNEFFGSLSMSSTVRDAARGSSTEDSLRNWFNQNLSLSLEPDQFAALTREALQRQVLQALDDRYYPEMRRMERQVLLGIVDSAWKDHLLAMDHLRSAISLKGYAQMDPKVEYKREGMKMYGQMWFAIGERMTDLIFRMEGLDENFVSSTMKETSARHDAPASPAELAEEQPIRNMGQRVGRNDPCPCGSGKKFKACCMDKN
jgi:preprotein translocase subunit SecA